MQYDPDEDRIEDMEGFDYQSTPLSREIERQSIIDRSKLKSISNYSFISNTGGRLSILENKLNAITFGIYPQEDIQSYVQRIDRHVRLNIPYPENMKDLLETWEHQILNWINYDLNINRKMETFVTTNFLYNHNFPCAIFDLDHTLISPTKGKWFSINRMTNTYNYTFTYDTIPSVMSILSKNHNIYIVSNQLNSPEVKINTIKELANLLEVELCAFVMTGMSKYRKPGNRLIKDFPNLINNKESFYVGDQGFCIEKSTDYWFAANCGLKFITPEKLFVYNEHPESTTSPSKLISNYQYDKVKNIRKYITKMVEKDNILNIVISGPKSSMVEKYVILLKYIARIYVNIVPATYTNDNTMFIRLIPTISQVRTIKEYNYFFGNSEDPPDTKGVNKELKEFKYLGKEGVNKILEVNPWYYPLETIPFYIRIMSE